MKTLLFSLLMLSLAPPCWCQEQVLNLDQAVQEASQNNADLKSLQAAAQAADWKKLEALSAALPHVDLVGNQVLQQKYLYLSIVFGPLTASFPEALPSSTFDLSLRQVIFDGFGAWHAYQAASLNAGAAQKEYEDAAFRLACQVRLRYYQALAAQQLAEVAKQNISTLEDHLRLAQASERSGLGTRFDVLRIMARLEEARAQQALEQDNIVLARQNLAQILGRAAEDRALNGQLPVPNLGLAQNLSATATDQLSQVAVQSLRQQAAQQGASAANAFWWPRLSFYADGQFYHYDSYDPAILSTNGYQPAYSLGLSLDWPLFDGGLSLSRQRQAEAQAQQASQALQALSLRLPNEADHWKRRYSYNATLYQARLRSLEESQESVRLANLGLRAGTRTHSEILDAELDLFNARAGLVRAQSDAAEALTNLEMILGRSLEP